MSGSTGDGFTSLLMRTEGSRKCDGIMKITFAYGNYRHAHAIEYVAEELMLRDGTPFHICSYSYIAENRVDSLTIYGRERRFLAQSEDFAWMYTCESSFRERRHEGCYPLPNMPIRDFEEVLVLFWGGQNHPADEDDSAREIRKQFPWVERELWEDAYFARVVGDEVTSDMITRYVRFHEKRENQPE